MEPHALFQKEPSRTFWKYTLDTITSVSTNGEKIHKRNGEGAEKRPGVRCGEERGQEERGSLDGVSVQ